MSNSGNFIKNRGEPPIVSPYMAKSVSQYRKESLGDEVVNGKFRESATPLHTYGDDSLGPTRAGFARASSGVNKFGQAQTFGGGAGGAAGSGYRGPGGTVRQTPEVYSPLWLNSNMNLPRDRATINAWSRSYFALNPMVQNAISLHSTYPISKLNIKCKNSKAKQFFETMIEEIELMNICVQIAQEFWTLGEAFVYAELDERAAKWSRILIQNPDYMVVKRSVIAGEPIISLRPDENLRRIVTSNRPSDIQQRQQLDKKIIEHVRRGENIPLSNFYVSHLARRISPYEIRGTGLIISCFRQLMLFDKLRESKFAQADNMINPLTLIKVGGQDYKPTPADLDAWRQLFEESQYDKDFKIFTHEAVTVERVGAGQGIYDISNDITQLIKEIYIGLVVPQVLMDGGADTTYANGSVALDVLRQRYMQFRNMLAAWLRRKIFAPIAKINDFYEYKDGEKVLIVPEVEWNHMSLFDMGDYISNLTQLASAQPPKVSLQTLYRSLGLEYEDETRKIRTENIQNVIAMKEMESLNRMALADLRSITDEKEIQEVVESPLPGESPYDAAGGMPPPGGMPGGMPELGGLPGLGGPPGGGGLGAPPAPLGGGGPLGGGPGGGPQGTPI
jgi:hypothetical protein